LRLLLLLRRLLLLRASAEEASREVLRVEASMAN